MRNRLVMGALRYGLLGDINKPQYDRIPSLLKRISEFQQTGNDEILVDIANIALLEFEEGAHPKKHWTPIDDDRLHTSIKENQ